MATNSGDGDKKFTVRFNSNPKLNMQILFDTSKKEMLNPNQGYKKIVQKLKTRYKVGLGPISNCFSAKLTKMN